MVWDFQNIYLIENAEAVTGIIFDLLEKDDAIAQYDIEWESGKPWVGMPRLKIKDGSDQGITIDMFLKVIDYMITKATNEDHNWVYVK